MSRKRLSGFASWRQSDSRSPLSPYATTSAQAAGAQHGAAHATLSVDASAVRRGPVDGLLLLTVVLLLLVGEVMVFNTSYFHGFERFNSPYRFFWKHQVAILLGLLGLTMAASVSSAVYRRLTYPLLMVALLGLIVVLLPGMTGGKVHRWLHLGGFNFQPSELAKGAVVLYLAYALSKKAQQVASVAYGLLPPLLIVGLVVVLIAVEPDLGGAAFISLTLFAMLFVIGARMRHLTALALGGVLLLSIGIYTADYRKGRLDGFWCEEKDKQGACYQLNQSLVAVGSGGIHGVGLGESRQKMFFLPEAHTDFILAIVGEETGLWGTVGILSLFTFLGIRGLRVAVRHPHTFGRLLAFGCTFLLVGQAGLNMAVVLGMLPTKGLTLPFISYGGSSLVMALTYTGILLSLSREIRNRDNAYA